MSAKIVNCNYKYVTHTYYIIIDSGPQPRCIFRGWILWGP